MGAAARGGRGQGGGDTRWAAHLLKAADGGPPVQQHYGCIFGRGLQKAAPPNISAKKIQKKNPWEMRPLDGKLLTFPGGVARVRDSETSLCSHPKSMPEVRCLGELLKVAHINISVSSLNVSSFSFRILWAGSLRIPPFSINQQQKCSSFALCWRDCQQKPDPPKWHRRKKIAQKDRQPEGQRTKNGAAKNLMRKGDLAPVHSPSSDGA